LRVNSGIYNGMKLVAPEGRDTRPLGAKIRQAVGNMLAPYSDDAFMLDLFAGTGSVGISMISRGAKGCVFVESNRQTLKFLEKNISELMRRAEKNDDGKLPQIELIAADMRKVWRMIAGFGPYDLIWADPPFKDAVSMWPEIKEQCTVFLKPGGILGIQTDLPSGKAILETHEDDKNWTLMKQKKYGGSMVFLFERLAE
jgi:16S rRNA (guanine966-N2)-methyltransferase